MDVLISGLGVAGPTLAYWLRRGGFNPTIVEEAPAPRNGGYVIDFWGVGFDIAEKMGLIPDLMERGYIVQEVRMVGADGRKVGGFDAKVFSRATGGRYVSLPRGELSAALQNTIGDVEVIFADSIAALRESADSVEVTFERAPARRFDLVVGCDGLHSRVRNLTFGQEDPFETYLGYKVAAFETSGYRPREEDVYVTYGLPGRQAARFAMKDDKTLMFFVFAEEAAAQVPAHELAAQKAALHAHFDGTGWESGAIMDALDRTDSLYFDRVSQIRMPAWTRGRVALVGDAAYCPSLLAGEGSALAMAGAYVLAGELARAGGNHAKAFARYDEVLRDFITGKQDAAKGFAGSFAPRTALGLAFRNLVTHAFDIPFVADLFLGNSVRDDITLPDYAI